MRVGSLFSGIGGFDLAAEWIGWSTAWFSEIDPFACAVLAHHWPDVPNLGDITAVDFTTVEPIDVLVGGFPCQDISNAGKREGITGARSSLWKEYARAIRELRPRYVVVENVAALKSRGLDVVLGDLADLGYDAEWCVFGADDVGAPHQRHRIWIVASRPFSAADDHAICDLCEEPYCARHDEHYADCTCIGPDSCTVADGDGAGREGWVRRGTDSQGEGFVGSSRRRRPVYQQPAQDWWAAEPSVGRVAHGVSGRVAQLKALGNSIVPQCAFAVYQSIVERERRIAEGEWDNL